MNSRHLFVSVVIPTYNSAHTIIPTLESVFNQTFKDYEIIVVDDGSTDETRECLDPYIQSGKITYVYQENKGCGPARNKGIEHASGTYIAFLDSDDIWLPEKLQLQVNQVKKYPDGIVFYTEARTIVSGDLIPKQIVRTFFTSPRSGRVLMWLAFHNIVTMSSAMVRTDVLRKAVGFSLDRTIMFFEDYDLWLRLAEQGPFYFIEQPLVLYRTRHEISNESKRYNYGRVREVFYRRILDSSFSSKPWYILGWLRASAVYYMHPIRTLKKIGLKRTLQELWRRIYLRIDFLVYPYLMYMLKNRHFNTIDDICNFSYRGSLRLLVPGQIESEIRTFLTHAQAIHPKNVLELGTAHGGNLFLLTKIAEGAGSIISIDLPNGDFGGGYFARKQAVYRRFGSDGQTIHLIRNDSHVPETRTQVESILGTEKIDVLFIDADHTYEGVKADFELYSSLVGPGGIIGFHDIANPPESNYGVQKFWNEIKHSYRHEEIIADRNQLGYGIGVLFL